MPNNIVHFAVHADDVERAKGFYGSVFGWQFEDWGPPEFYRVRTGTEEEPGVGGALQKRRGQSADQPPMIGYECTIGVDDVDETAAAVEKHGGQGGHAQVPDPGRRLAHLLPRHRGQRRRRHPLRHLTRSFLLFFAA